ncbi:MAG: hypothetical protein NTV00_03360 [Methylococcales bacterium]|nr:hypothetical protein [Methylococcales bacterium]
MNISLNNSAIKAISSANFKASSAAQSIASSSVANNPSDNRDISTSVVNLKEAEIQNAAGVKLLQTEQKMLGSILDIKV